MEKINYYQMNKEKLIFYQKQYNFKNYQKIKEYNKSYYYRRINYCREYQKIKKGLLDNYTNKDIPINNKVVISNEKHIIDF